MESQVRAVSIDFGVGPVMPGPDEVAAGKYDKLSRTVYMDVNTAALAKSSEDATFANLGSAARLAIPRKLQAPGSGW